MSRVILLILSAACTCCFIIGLVTGVVIGRNSVSANFTEALQTKAQACGKLYTVVNADGTLRCAQLVPGVVWQPYMTVEEEEETRLAYLKRLAKTRGKERNPKGRP